MIQRSNMSTSLINKLEISILTRLFWIRFRRAKLFYLFKNILYFRKKNTWQILKRKEQLRYLTYVGSIPFPILLVKNNLLYPYSYYINQAKLDLVVIWTYDYKSHEIKFHQKLFGSKDPFIISFYSQYMFNSRSWLYFQEELV